MALDTHSPCSAPSPEVPHMRRILAALLVALFVPVAAFAATAPATPQANPPIYVAFLWHMHQPIYWPYENVMTTQANSRYSYSVANI
jgi:hypothetical protein